jgi:hypothetical protein
MASSKKNGSWRYGVCLLLAKSPSKCKIQEGASDRGCAFGKWCCSPEGQALAHIPVFQEVGRQHREVHRLAKEIVEPTRQGSHGRAKKLLQELETAYSAARKRRCMLGGMFFRRGCAA